MSDVGAGALQSKGRFIDPLDPFSLVRCKVGLKLGLPVICMPGAGAREAAPS